MFQCDHTRTTYGYTTYLAGSDQNMKTTLSPRLQAIADEVIVNGIAADIGTDHGHLPVYLVKHKGLTHVIATDVNQDPLNKARLVIQRHKLQHQIELRLGDGLTILQAGETVTIVMAGMGGLLISELLENSPAIAHNTEKIILQPVQSAKELRQYLLENGYEITREKLVLEKQRFYEIICARYGNKPKRDIDPLVFEIGEFIQNQDPAVSKAFLKRKIRLTEGKKRGILKSETVNEEKVKEVERMLEKLKEALEWIIK